MKQCQTQPDHTCAPYGLRPSPWAVGRDGQQPPCWAPFLMPPALAGPQPQEELITMAPTQPGPLAWQQASWHPRGWHHCLLGPAGGGEGRNWHWAQECGGRLGGGRLILPPITHR